MSLSSTSWRHTCLLVVLVALDGCGGKMSDDEYEVLATGGVATGSTSSGGIQTNASFVVLGGVGPVTYGGAGRVSSSNTYGGSVPKPYGGSYPLGGSGAKPMGGTFSGGIYAGGGVKLSGGKPGAGGASGIPAGGGSGIPSGGVTHMGSGTGGSSSAVDVCMMSDDPGTCDGNIRKYFFNPEHGQCEAFIYGGCGGNANRFDNLGQCQKRCDTKSTMCPTDIPPTDQPLQCAISSVCYYQDDTGCACTPGYANGRSDCVALDPLCDEPLDASTPMWPDAGTETAPVVVVCTCGSPAWTCRTLRMLSGVD